MGWLWNDQMGIVLEMIPKSFKYKNPGPPCGLADIEEFEGFANTQIPRPYAEFLLECNGCIPSAESDTYNSPIELPGGNLVAVHQFYSLSSEASPLRDIHTELEERLGILPITMIPIGHDSFGNIIGLDCESGHVGWILCEARFHLDYLHAYDFEVDFYSFLSALTEGPYSEKSS